MSTDSHQQDLFKRYSMIIEWSDENDAYIVTLPEFPVCHTHGATREEALKNGLEVLEILVESEHDAWGQPLPTPKLFEAGDAERSTQRASDERPQQPVTVDAKRV
jgi:predicted RNase H-like HicB family nuclease